MTSLEFIEKEIEALNHQIEYIKSNMKKYIDFRTDGQFYIDEIQLKLNHLNQIKTELEAWEVVKNFITDIGKTYVLEIDDWYCKNEYQAIKKALEVKDEI